MVQEMIELQARPPVDNASPSDAALETALAHLDAGLASAQKALTAAQRELKQVAEASRQGNLRDLARLLEGAARMSATVSS